MTLKDVALKIKKELDELYKLHPARYVFSWYFYGENVGLSVWKKEDNENICLPQDPMEFILTNNGIRIKKTGRYNDEECHKVISELMADIDKKIETKIIKKTLQDIAESSTDLNDFMQRIFKVDLLLGSTTDFLESEGYKDIVDFYENTQRDK